MFSPVKLYMNIFVLFDWLNEAQIRLSYITCRPENIYRTIIYKIIRRPKYDWKILLIYYITVKSLANIQS